MITGLHNIANGNCSVDPSGRLMVRTTSDAGLQYVADHTGTVAPMGRSTDPNLKEHRIFRR
jgi:hypothetical protein